MVTSGIDPSDNQRQGPSGLADQGHAATARFAPNARELRVVGPDPEPLVPGVAEDIKR